MPQTLKVILTHSEGIELFSMIVSKIDNIEIEKFSDVSLITNRLDRYSEKDNHHKITEAIFGIKCLGRKGEKVYNHPRVVYDFVTALRFKQAFGWEESAFHEVALFLQISQKIFTTSFTLEKFSPSKKMSSFANSSWWLYFYEEIDDQYSHFENEKVAGISVAVIHFKKFAKFEISFFRANTHTNSSYEGIYDISNEKYLELTYQASNIRDSNLHARFYLEESIFDVLLGNMDSLNHPANATNTVLEKIFNVKKHHQKPFYYRIGIKKIDSQEIYVDVEDKNSGVALKLDIIRYFLKFPNQHPPRNYFRERNMNFSTGASFRGFLPENNLANHKRESFNSIQSTESRLKNLLELFSQKFLE